MNASKKKFKFSSYIMTFVLLSHHVSNICISIFFSSKEFTTRDAKRTIHTVDACRCVLEAIEKKNLQKGMKKS
jgi:hypothetical protein